MPPVAPVKPAARPVAKPVAAARPAAKPVAAPVKAAPAKVSSAAPVAARKGGRTKMIRPYSDGPAYHFADRVQVLLKSAKKMADRAGRWGDEDLNDTLSAFQEAGQVVAAHFTGMGDAGFAPPSRGFGATRNPILPGAQVYLTADALTLLSRSFPGIETKNVFAALTTQKGDTAIMCRLGSAAATSPSVGVLPKKWVRSTPIVAAEETTA